MIRNKNYEPVVDAELDLHGCYTNEARDEVRSFLKEAKQNKWSRIRIIVGKGLHSEDGVAILPDTVKALLKEQGLRYTYAKIQNGGEGALEVSL